MTLADYTDVQFNLNLPAGEYLNVTEDNQLYFSVTYFGTGFVGIPTVSDACTTAVTGTGPAPTDTGHGDCIFGPGGEGFGFTVDLNVFAGDQITGVSVTLPVPGTVPSFSDTYKYTVNLNPGFQFVQENATSSDTFVTLDSSTASPVPEPSTLITAATSLGGLLGIARTKRRKLA